MYYIAGRVFVLQLGCARKEGLFFRGQGDSENRFLRELQRRQRAHKEAQLTVPSYFFRDVIGLAALTQQQMDAWKLNQVLPGLGIESDLSFMADPVTIGLSVRARHDCAMVMCVCSVDFRTGALVAICWDGWSMPFGSHATQEMLDLLLKMIVKHPANISMVVLRQRLASLIGDGQLTKGGPDARHKKRLLQIVKRFCHEISFSIKNRAVQYLYHHDKVW